MTFPNVDNINGVTSLSGFCNVSCCSETDSLDESKSFDDEKLEEREIKDNDISVDETETNTKEDEPPSENKEEE